MSAPNFLEKPTIKPENGNKLLTFECKIKGEPQPEIQWYKGTHEITNQGMCTTIEIH